MASVVAAPKLLQVLNYPTPDQSIGGPQTVNLAAAFSMEAINDQVVRFTSQFQFSDGTPVVLDMALFSNRTPATRQNFLKYATDGDYVDSVIHRSIPGFVIQGGGFTFNGTGFTPVPMDPPVVNEFGISNTLGTISMAKVAGDPDSATSQWFVSLGENSDILDPQNGGFTVFGRMTRSTLGNAQIFGDPEIFPVYDYSGNFGGAFSELPVLPPDYALILFTGVSLVPLPAGEAGEDPALAYSIVSNSNPAVATANLQPNGLLDISPVAGQAGSTTITVRATDSVGNTVDDSFSVVVSLTDTYATWASRATFPNGGSGIAQNPDGDAWNNLQEFAFLGDPALTDQAGVSSSLAGTTTKFLTITFPVRKFTQGLTYSVEANNALSGTWTEVWKSSDGFSHAQVVSALDHADRTVVTVKDTLEIGTRRFLRVRLVQE